MKYVVSVDTLYINVRYPRSDVFNRWYPVIRDCSARSVRQGIPVGNFVVRNGAGGYLVSVWSHDVRAYLTDQVDEKTGDGFGMGIWVQIGPKFLLDHPPGDELRKAITYFIQEIGVRNEWPIGITRIDVAVDLIGVDLVNQDIELWRKGWVGRARISAIYFNPKSGMLETINVGSRKSAVYLRIYNKVAQAEAEGDLEYWREVWGGYSGPVTRVEWEVKPKKGGFKDFEDFNQLCEWKVVELINYLVGWGRLCIPNPRDSNNRRWEIAEFWRVVLSSVEEWADGITWPTSRLGKEFKGISENYIRFVGGTVAGAMARMDHESPTLYNMLDGMEKHGMSLKEIQKKADEKAEIYSRL